MLSGCFGLQFSSRLPSKKMKIVEASWQRRQRDENFPSPISPRKPPVSMTFFSLLDNAGCYNEGLTK